MSNWHQSDILYLQWDLIQGAEYSYVLSYDVTAEPDEIPDKPEGDLIWMGDIKYEGLEDNIYYFHLKQKLLGKDWSKKITFRAMIDSVSPEEFELDIAEIQGKNFLVFNGNDTMSGIDHYDILEISKPLFFGTLKKIWKTGESPYLLDDQKLKSEITVKAIDKAGNERIAKISPPCKISWKDLIFPLLILIVIVIVTVIVWRRIIKRGTRNL